MNLKEAYAYAKENNVSISVGIRNTKDSKVIVSGPKGKVTISKQGTSACPKIGVWAVSPFVELKLLTSTNSILYSKGNALKKAINMVR